MYSITRKLARARSKYSNELVRNHRQASIPNLDSQCSKPVPMLQRTYGQAEIVEPLLEMKK
jgi:hypothetical protein